MRRGRLEMLLVGHIGPLHEEAGTGRATTDKGLLFDGFNRPLMLAISIISPRLSDFRLTSNLHSEVKEATPYRL